jgi:hypothetical protein
MIVLTLFRQRFPMRSRSALIWVVVALLLVLDIRIVRLNDVADCAS